MHVIAWLLTQRAVEAGELTALQARKPARRLGEAAESDPGFLEQLPEAALHLVRSSSDLYARVRRLDEGSADVQPQPSPARSLLHRWNAPSDDCAGPGGPASVAFMTDYRFSYGPKLLSGEGATRHLGELLPDGPCLFVTDARILSLGLASAALEALEAAGVTAVIFDAIEQDPSDRKSTRLNSSH